MTIEWRSKWLLAGCLLLGCGSHAGGAATAPAQAAGAISFDGDPNGIAWDGERGRLVIADDANNRLLAWREGGVATLAAVPSDSGKAGLGQPVIDANGGILVPRFGHGESGAVIKIDPQGHASTLPGLDPKRRRIGLAASDGRLFETFFEKVGDHRQGGVAEVQANGGEIDLAAFHKPVGVITMGNALFVSDQDEGAVFRCATHAPAQCARFATVEQPDLLAAGPAGSLLTGGRGGQIRQIDAAGAVKVIATFAGEVRGLAWDGAARLFVARRAQGGRAAIEIVPLSR